MDFRPSWSVHPNLVNKTSHQRKICVSENLCYEGLHTEFNIVNYCENLVKIFIFIIYLSKAIPTFEACLSHTEPRHSVGKVELQTGYHACYNPS